MRNWLTAAILCLALAGTAAALDEAEHLDRMVALLQAPAGCTPGTADPGWERHVVTNPADGYRLRYSRFGCELGARGAIVLLPGRSESSYGYYETAIDFIARGYGPVYAVDHRGQGLSPRLLDDPHKGHIARFEDYIDDTEVFVGAVVADLRGLGAGPDPVMYLTGNSMGGAIAIGYLQKVGAAAPFGAAALLGAMIRVNYISFTGKKASWLNLRIYSEAGALLQARWRCSILALWDYDRCDAFAIADGFGGYRPGSRQFRPDTERIMTHSAARYAFGTYMWEEFDWSAIAAAEYQEDENWQGPQLGGATNSWVREAARFNRQMRRPDNLAKLVHVPLMLLTGSRDLRAYRPYAAWRGRTPDLSRHIDFCAGVNAAALASVRRYMCEFVVINGAFHELFKERDAERLQALETVDWFFRSQSE